MAMERYAGVMSGWNKITTEDPDNPTPTGEHAYTLPDFFAILRDLVSKLDPETLKRIEKLIVQHRDDKNNPHNTTFDQLGLDVVQELHNLWLSRGNDGDQETFLKILFQYIKIADLATTLLGTTTDEIPSVRGAVSLLTQHNTDPNAHEPLFNLLMPGTPIPLVPAFSLQATAGVPRGVVVERNSPCAYTDKDGRIRVAPPNVLPIDYSFGEPVFSIWGTRANYIPYSEDLLQAGVWQPSEATLQFDSNAVNPRGEKGVFKLVESVSAGPADHQLICTPGVDCAANEDCIISIYVKPAERYCFGIETLQGIGGPYSYVHFNLETQDVFIHDGALQDRIAGGVVPLANGWFRCWYALRTTNAARWVLRFYPLDIFDGDNNYVGDGVSGLYLWGAHLARGLVPPPYIQTVGQVVQYEGTSVVIPATDWFSPQAGTVVTEVLTPAPLDTQTAKEIYTLGNGVSSIALNARYPTTHKGRAFFAAYNENNAPLANQWGQPVTPDQNQFSVLVHGYTSTKHLFGFPNGDPAEVTVIGPINPGVTTLYLGCDRYKSNPLDGYIRSFTYYPDCLTPDNVKFLLGA